MIQVVVVIDETRDVLETGNIRWMLFDYRTWVFDFRILQFLEQDVGDVLAIRGVFL
jgi:hypothetical protein